MKRTLVITMVFIGVIAGLALVYVQLRPGFQVTEKVDQKEKVIPKAGFIEGMSNAISKHPKPGNATSVTIDFEQCSRGGDVVYLGLGSTHFAFEGISDSTCIFYHGTEIENPTWGGDLAKRCKVPIGVGQRSFSVRSSGIDFGSFDREYCVAIGRQPEF